ncbi:hypothetical protein PC41400_24360 [Paenibacillus chitinolyticus]|uniref:Sporulation initiation phosphotransferase B n=1 Tax=Paenibacillus chitinolyticus TaxID=79263 RepID=A0A410X206_9BACL|nr:Spo0B domain-containing protein [Paenibacillus chitinolyticus]MCY9592734.1 sporulation initiation phosphotransferase B [Paenibacillus chitinolyticus]MCY9597440.1 sporulation initiation phosphotransferase B [Paenibacillus chitinolyticus]QAV20645.1 hypothetical protein PC41400_24360 [Paenibacillus chitinolyticus]
MGNRLWIPAALLGLLGLIMLAAAPLTVGLRLAAGIVTAACFAAVLYIRHRMKLKEAEEERARIQRLAQQEMLLTINHLRHDWMNDIQVLLGYIQLKKYDHLHGVVAGVMGKLQHESFMAKLGDPGLIVFLLTAKAEGRHMKLEVELDQEVNIRKLALDGDAVCKLIPELIEGFKQASAGENEEGGMLSMQLVPEEGSLLLDFVYQGPYNRGLLEEALSLALESGTGRTLAAVVEQNDYQEQEAALALRLPYRTSVEV